MSVAYELRRGLSPSKVALLERVLSILSAEATGQHGCLVMTGAGVSTSAGIPDFRSPNGLYGQLAKYKISRPEDVFVFDLFKEDPRPYFRLAKEFSSGRFRATSTHRFIKRLNVHGKLRRCYTQNVDSLDHTVGIPSKKVIQAHGSFRSAHCVNGHRAHLPTLQTHVQSATPYYCPACKAPVKHDIVMFGERLPSKFRNKYVHDFQHCDLLMVLGTSLTVSPFNMLPSRLASSSSSPRVFINRERAGEGREFKNPFRFDDDASNDLFLQGECDQVVEAITSELGWRVEERRAMITPNSLG